MRGLHFDLELHSAYSDLNSYLIVGMEKTVYVGNTIVTRIAINTIFKN